MSNEQRNMDRVARHLTDDDKQWFREQLAGMERRIMARIEQCTEKISHNIGDALATWVLRD